MRRLALGDGGDDVDHVGLAGAAFIAAVSAALPVSATVPIACVRRLAKEARRPARRPAA